MNISVNELSVEDREHWGKLYQGYADFYHMPMTEEILDTVWGWVFDENNKFYGLIAKSDNGEIVGLMHFREMASPLRGKVVGFLDDLYVVPQSRGLGVVDALFRGLKDAARQYQWPFVRWITAEDNYRGRAVYDKISNKTQWQTYQMDVD